MVCVYLLVRRKDVDGECGTGMTTAMSGERKWTQLIFKVSLNAPKTLSYGLHRGLQSTIEEVADAVVEPVCWLVMCPHRHVMASLSGCERCAFCSRSLQRVPLVVPSKATAHKPKYCIIKQHHLFTLCDQSSKQSVRYGYALTLAFILHAHAHTFYLLSTIIPLG